MNEIPLQVDVRRAGARRGQSRLSVVFSLAFAMAACGDGDGSSVTNPNEPGPEPASVTVEPASVNLVVGAKARLAVTVRDRDGGVLSPEVTWHSASESVAFASSWAHPEGLAHEVQAVGVGTTTLTATAGAAVDSVQVTVTR